MSPILPFHYYATSSLMTSVVMSCHRSMGLFHIAPWKRENGCFPSQFFHAFILLNDFGLPRRFNTEGPNYWQFALSVCFTLLNSIRMAHCGTGDHGTIRPAGCGIAILRDSDIMGMWDFLCSGPSNVLLFHFKETKPPYSNFSNF